jgi:3-oxoacyl-[acyl-carrier protein] reductase
MAMKMSIEDWNTVLAVNLSGSFYMAQPALEHMVERGTGRIIFVSSVIGETGNIGQANYAASKAGMLGLTKTLAKEAAFILARAGRLEENGVGITVNTVTPGFVATEMLENVPEKVWTRSSRPSPSAGCATPKRSPGLSTSWPRTPPHTSRARSGASTAAWTCSPNGQRQTKKRPRLVIA